MLRKLKPLPFRYRMMLAMIVTLLLPMTLVNMLIFSVVRDQMLQDAGDWMEGITKNVGRTFDSYLQLVQGATKNPLFDYMLMEIFDSKRMLQTQIPASYTLEERAQINGWLAMLFNMDHGILSAVFVDTHGTRFYLGSHNSHLDEGEIIRQSVELGGDTYISRPTYNSRGEMVFCISRSMVNPANFQHVATLLIYIRLDFLEQFAEAAAESVDMKIIDADQVIIADRDPQALGSRLDFHAPSITYATYPLSETDWILVGSIPTSVLFEKIDNIQQLVLAVNLLLVVVTLFMIYLISSNLTEPLRHLAKVMQNAYKTQFREVTVPIRRRDEIGMITLSFNQMIKHIHQLIDKIIDVEQRRKQSQITALQAQINPHFLYNSLYMIAMQAELDENYKISEMAFLLSKLLRYSVGKDSEAVEVRQECEHLHTYIRLMQYRFPKVELETDVDDEVKDWIIMRLILQPIVENAIIHGLVPKDGNGKITVSIRRARYVADDDRLLIRIADDGIGMSREKVSFLMEYLRSEREPDGSERRIGMKNVFERLAFFYGDHFRFELHSEEGRGTVCEIDIPRKHL